MTNQRLERNQENQCRKEQTTITDDDYKMAKYIWSILFTEPVIMASWGISPETVKPYHPLGIEFHVQGFIHLGRVQIVLDESSDTFTATLIPDSDKKEIVIEGIYLDNLVDVIDQNVEKTPDYQERLSEEGYGAIEIVNL